MNRDFFYRLLSSRIAVGLTVLLFLLFTAAVLFRIIPWWLYFVLLVVGVAGVVVYAIVSDWMAMRADRKFIDAMRGQGETQIGKQKAKDQDSARLMQQRWMEGFEQLQKTLGKKGGRKAVYFLPWYVIIGKPATGKTTAIRNAGLHFPMGMPKLVGTGGTKNCDWFFTEEAVLLDTAGRYTTSGESESDKDEWHQFLGLVGKYRPDMPINGLLVAVPADDLLEREREDVVNDAREMRSRIDELMTQLGIQFPVYLLITKCDLIQGFTDFFGKLEKSRHTELLGWTSPSFELDDLGKAVEEGFERLGERCKDLRPALMRDETDAVALRNVFLFPEELVQTTKMLAQYCDVLFRQSKYSDSPFLRGIYFTSALQTGNTVSALLGRLGLTASAKPVTQGSRSFFLQDFFQARLKADQRLVAPTGSAATKGRVFNNVGLGVIALVSILAALLFTTSYVGNRRLLLRVEDAVAATDGIQSKPPAEQMAVLGDYLTAIEQLREENRSPSWLQRFGFYTGRTLEGPVVERFLGIYERVAYKPALDAAIAAMQRTGEPGQAFGALDTLVAHLMSTRQARSSSLETGGESLAPWLPGLGPEPPEAREQFAHAYRFYLHEPWRFGAAPKLQERAEAERREQVSLVAEKLPQLLRVDTVVRWLEDGDFIRATDASKELRAPAAQVRPAFTPKSWQERIVPLFRNLSLIQEDVGTEAWSALSQEYAGAYFEEWYTFVSNINDADAPCQLHTAPYFEALGLVYRDTTTPFRMTADKPEPAAGGAGGGDGARFIPGFEPPPWVGGVGRVAGERKAYAEKMDQACFATKGGGSACEAVDKLPEGAAGGGSAQVASWVREGLVGVPEATDPDDQRLRTQIATLLSAPIGKGREQLIAGCKDEMGKGAGAVKSACSSCDRAPRKIDDLQACVARPSGAVWEFCEKDLGRFFNCVSVTDKPNAKVRVPGDVSSWLRRCNQLSKTFFSPAGGWRRHNITFTSVPSISEMGTVVETTLEITCGDVWELSHKNYEVNKTLQWDPSECSLVRIEARMQDGSTRAIERQDPFGLMELLAEAKRSGSEYSWNLEGDTTVAFKVRLQDASVLDYFRR